jgi:hypothetical protein
MWKFKFGITYKPEGNNLLVLEGEIVSKYTVFYTVELYFEKALLISQ